MPLFATAMIIPLLVVVLGVMRSTDDGHERLSAPEAAKVVFSGMFSSVIMLLLGGFAIAGSLSKFGIAKSMATFVLSRAGTRPSRVLLVNMFVATVTSMWISNVAAPVLCFSLIQVWLHTYTHMECTCQQTNNSNISISPFYAHSLLIRPLVHA